MNPQKKQEILYNRLKATNSLTHSFIDHEIKNKNVRIQEIEYDINQIKLIKPIKLAYIDYFKKLGRPSPTQKVVANCNIAALQIETAAFTDALHELIDEIKLEITNLQEIKMKIDSAI